MLSNVVSFWLQSQNLPAEEFWFWVLSGWYLVHYSCLWRHKRGRPVTWSDPRAADIFMPNIGKLQLLLFFLLIIHTEIYLYAHMCILLKYLKQLVKAFNCSQSKFHNNQNFQTATTLRLGIIRYLKKLRRPNKALYCNGESEVQMSFSPYLSGET